MIMYRNRGIISITVIVWYTNTRLSIMLTRMVEGRKGNDCSSDLRVREGAGHSWTYNRIPPDLVVSTYYNLSVGGASILLVNSFYFKRGQYCTEVEIFIGKVHIHIIRRCTYIKVNF